MVTGYPDSSDAEGRDNAGAEQEGSMQGPWAPTSDISPALQMGVGRD